MENIEHRKKNKVAKIELIQTEYHRLSEKVRNSPGGNNIANL